MINCPALLPLRTQSIWHWEGDAIWSALQPFTGIRGRPPDVCFRPKADIASFRLNPKLTMLVLSGTKTMLNALRMLLLAALMPSPAFAIDAKQPPSAPSIEATTVVIPFRPPLDKPLVYSLSDPSFRGKAELTLRFERSGAAYTLRSAVQAASIEQGDLFKIISAHPLVLNVSAEGQITGIVDEAAYWSRVSTAFEVHKRTSSDHESVGKLLDLIRSKPTEQRITFITKYQRLVLDGIGTHQAMSRPGTPATFGILQQSITLDPAKATIVSRGGAGPEAMQRLFTYILSLGAPYDGPPNVQASVRTEVTMVIDRRTGLVTAYEQVADRQLAGRTSRSRMMLQLHPTR
jgi:hypothetical protein